MSGVSVAFAAPTAVPPLLIPTAGSADAYASKETADLTQCTGDFCNKIGPERRFWTADDTSVFRGEADLMRRSLGRPEWLDSGLAIWA